MKKLFYFAYGSNMLQARIEARVKKVKHGGTYKLHNWKLAFNCGLSKHSYANIIEGTSNDFVEGVLYELREYQIYALDKFEGYPFNYEKKYFVLPDGNIAFAYVSVDPYFASKRKPEVEYLNLLIMGARENKLYRTTEALSLYKENLKKRGI